MLHECYSFLSRRDIKANGNAGFICKTDRNIDTQIKEHRGIDKNSPIFNYFI